MTTEFQLIVKNSFVEFLEEKPEVPRPKSWSHSLCRDANRIAQSEPFTLRASWADPRLVILSGSSSSAMPPGLSASTQPAGEPVKLTAEVLAAFNEGRDAAFAATVGISNSHCHPQQCRHRSP